MKVHVKVVCVLLVMLFLVVENESWWFRRRSRSSRGSSTSSTSRGSSRRSSSSRYRSRSSSSFRSFRVPACSLRFGTFTSECYSKPKVDVKPRSTKAPSTWRYTQCSLRFGCIHGVTRTSQCKVFCEGSGGLVKDIDDCKGHWKVTLPKPKNRTSVFAKRVIEVQIVERPMGKCGGKASEDYDEGTIKCLQCKGYKTSMSGKKDRVMHSGVIVKTEDGSKYLIHKGKKFGSFGKRTVIEKPNYAMYYKGYRNVNHPIKPKKLRRVEDYFRASGNWYHFKYDNCHDGTTRMINLAKKP